MNVATTSDTHRFEALVLFAALLICGCGGSTTGNGSSRPDLQAWSRLGDIDWRIDRDAVEAGPIEAIRPPDGAGYLVSSREFADFRLTVEFWIEDDTNSGVFILGRLRRD